jgi:hypothetical protein
MNFASLSLDSVRSFGCTKYSTVNFALLENLSRTNGYFVLMASYWLNESAPMTSTKYIISNCRNNNRIDNRTLGICRIVIMNPFGYIACKQEPFNSTAEKTFVESLLSCLQNPNQDQSVVEFLPSHQFAIALHRGVLQ